MRKFLISNRVEARNLLDVLLNIDHWSGFTQYFGPLSGEDAKLRKARSHYLLTTFAMGTRLDVNHQLSIVCEPPARDLLEQRRDLRRLIDILAGRRHSHDLTAISIDRQM